MIALLVWPLVRTQSDYRSFMLRAGALIFSSFSKPMMTFRGRKVRSFVPLDLIVEATSACRVSPEAISG